MKRQTNRTAALAATLIATAFGISILATFAAAAEPQPQTETHVRPDGSTARYQYVVHDDGSVEIQRSVYDFRFAGIPAELAPAITADTGTTTPLEPLPFDDSARVRYVPAPADG